MRNAEEIVQHYLDKGYSIERIRVLASTKPDPIKQAILAVLAARAANGSSAAEITAAPAGPPAAPEPAAPAPKAESGQPKRDERKPAKDDAARTAAAADSLRRRLADLETQAQRARELEAKVQRLEAALNEAHAATEKLDNKARENGAEVDAKARQLAALQAGITAAQKERSDVAAKAQSLEKRVAALAQAELDLMRSREDLASTTEDLNHTREELKAMQEEHAAAESDLTTARQELETARADVESVRAQLAERERLNAELLAERETLRTEVQEKTTAAADLHQQLDANAKTLAELKVTIDERDTELHDLRDRFDREAGELRTRAKQTVRMMQNKVTLYQYVGMIGSAAALLLLCVIIFTSTSRRAAPAGGAPAVIPDAGVPADFAPAKPGDGSTSGKQELPAPGQIKGGASTPAVEQLGPAGTAGADNGQDFIAYRVRPNESLWKICHDQLKDASPAMIARVKELNQIPDINRLKVGQSLKLPRPAPQP